MKAVIPVAGKGTRLRPLTHTTPKALMPVGSKPIIAHIAESLIKLGCSHFVLIISPDGEAIKDYLETRYPKCTVDAVVQEQKLGLGHAVGKAKDIVGNDELIVMYGDTIIDGDLSGVVNPDADAMITVLEVEDPRRFGVVYLDDGNIVKFVEKPDEPESNLAIVGCNYFREAGILFECIEEVIDKDIKTKGEYQITDAFELMIGSGIKMKPHVVSGWYDCGTPPTLLEANRFMLDTEETTAQIAGSIIIPPVSIPESAAVEDSIIGPYVSVGENAVIRHSTVTDSIIGTNAETHDARLDKSIIGNHAVVRNMTGRFVIGDHSVVDSRDGV